jgi:hypothetical protein
MSGKGQWFQCGLCRELFIKGREDEESIEEYLNENYGDTGKVSVVCDQCFKEFQAWRREQENQQ